MTLLQAALKKLRKLHFPLALLSLFFGILAWWFSSLSQIVYMDQYLIYLFFWDLAYLTMRYLAITGAVLWAFAFIKQALFFARRKTLALIERMQAKKALETPDESGKSPAAPVSRPGRELGLFFKITLYELDSLLLVLWFLASASFLSDMYQKLWPTLLSGPTEEMTFFYDLPAILLIGFVCTGLGVLAYHLRNQKKSLTMLLQAGCLLMFWMNATFCTLWLINRDISYFTQWMLAATGILLMIGVSVGLIQQIRPFGHINACELTPFVKIRNARERRQERENPARKRLWDRVHLSIQSMWTLRFALNLVPYTVLFIGLLFWLSTCVYTVKPQQQALVYRFGTLNAESIVSPGLHWKLPVPVETVEIHDVRRVQNLFIGYEPAHNNNYLWTSQHGGTEYTLLSGNGNELVAVNIRLNYHIGDLPAYRTRYNDPAALLSARAYAVLMERTMSSNLDTVLNVNRETLANEILNELNRYSEERQIGLVVGEVIIENIHPPVEVASVYQNVVNAAIQKSTLLSQARAYADERINQAQEQKASDVNAALAVQISRVAQAQSAAQTFLASCEAYLQSPESYTLRKLTNAYENITRGAKLYVFSPKMKMEMERFLLQNGQTVTIVE